MNWDKLRELILENARRNTEEYDALVHYRFNPLSQKSKLIVSIVLEVIGIIIIFSPSLFESSLWYHFTYIGVFYFAGLTMISMLSAWYRQGNFGKIYIIPLLIFSLIEPLFSALYIISMFIALLLITVALFYIKLIPFIFTIQLTETTELFLEITTMTVISATWGDKIMIRIGNFGWTGKENEINNEFALEILNQKKIRLITFILFFILFVVLKISTFQELPILGRGDNFKEINNSVLASFICYIAWDRILVTYRSMKAIREIN